MAMKFKNNAVAAIASGLTVSGTTVSVAVGSGVDRITADAALLICVTAHGMPWRGMLMFVVLRVFGWIFYHDQLGRLIRWVLRK